MSRLRALLRRRFGAWWWIVFIDPKLGAVGPMRLSRARRWAEDAPAPCAVVWWQGPTRPAGARLFIPEEPVI